MTKCHSEFHNILNKALQEQKQTDFSQNAAEKMEIDDWDTNTVQENNITTNVASAGGEEHKTSQVEN